MTTSHYRYDMEEERQRLTPEERANLIAYLDGELDQNETELLKSRIGRSAVVQRELQSLQKSWQVLEVLELGSATPSLGLRIRSLVEAVSSRDQLAVQAPSTLVDRALRLLVVVVLSAVMFIAGWMAARWFWPDRSAALARDLSIAEHLDAYRAVDSLEFLRQLDESPEIHELAD